MVRMISLFFVGYFFLCSYVYAEQLKVGFIVPMTGSAALMGESLNGVAKLAKLQHVISMFEDDQCDGKQALSAYLKLRNEDVHVFYMACSGSILAVAPLAKKNGDLIVTTYAGSSKIRETGDEVIRLNPDAISVAEGMLPLLGADNRPTIILYEEQEYAESLAVHLSNLLGSDVIERLSYKANSPSFAAEVLKIRRRKPKSIVVVPVGDGAARILLKELSQQHVAIPVIGEVNLCDFPFKPSEFGLHGQCVAAKFQGRAFDQFLVDYSSTVGHEPAYPFYDAMALDLLSKVDQASAQHVQVSALKADLLKGFTGSFASYELTAAGEPKSAGEYLQKVQF